MDQIKIKNAVERLEQNLPLRGNQQRLPESLRRLHQSILVHFLETGKAPVEGDIDYCGDWTQAIERLAAEKIIVTGQEGAITGAYPFVDEAREFRIFSTHGAVSAMCAFDALAVSSMFQIPTRIESRCRISGAGIAIEQNEAEIFIIAPDTEVFGAINWNARDSEVSCSASLCTEMVFIAGAGNANRWRAEDPEQRELFKLDEAHAFITAVFLPLMSAGPADRQSA